MYVLIIHIKVIYTLQKKVILLHFSVHRMILFYACYIYRPLYCMFLYLTILFKVHFIIRFMYLSIPSVYDPNGNGTRDGGPTST